LPQIVDRTRKIIDDKKRDNNDDAKQNFLHSTLPSIIIRENSCLTIGKNPDIMGFKFR